MIFDFFFDLVWLVFSFIKKSDTILSSVLSLYNAPRHALSSSFGKIVKYSSNIWRFSFKASFKPLFTHLLVQGNCIYLETKTGDLSIFLECDVLHKDLKFSVIVLQALISVLTGGSPF